MTSRKQVFLPGVAWLACAEEDGAFLRRERPTIHKERRGKDGVRRSIVRELEVPSVEGKANYHNQCR
jgi:hypothetical protein